MFAVRMLAAVTLCFALAPAAQARAVTHHVTKPKRDDRMMASVYWQGTRVAAGRKFDPDAMTVAHRSLPFGTRLLVYYGGNAAEVIVNDRGPFVRGRDIDLSRGVAKALHFSGVGRVRVVYWPPLPQDRPASLMSENQ
jgi:rare lipoprotein A